MHDRLLAYIRQHQLMGAGDRVGVAVSGGADSTALLRLLLDLREPLGIVLSVVHFNHKLRAEESDEDEAFVRALAEAHSLEFFRDCGDTRAHAAQRKCGLEAAARELRYQFFWKVIEEEKLFRIATAHTMDDQAETVVLRFLRGAGTRGEAGIHPFVGEALRTKEEWWQGEGLVRPLLEFRRAQLRHYLRRSGQTWREDASNQDPAFTRNRLRQAVMPKLRELNPALEQVLGETAEIARAEEDYWQLVVGKTLAELGVIGRSSMAGVDTRKLDDLPLALQRRVIRALAEREGTRLEFHHVQQILELAGQPPTRAEKRIELPDGYEACLRERELRLRRRSPSLEAREYEWMLPVPGEVVVPVIGLKIRARTENSDAPRLASGKLGVLCVRNWRPGDRYWPAHSREAKKVKELLQDRRVPAESRAAWPVVVSEVEGRDEIVWVPGFEYPERLLAGSSEPGILLEYEFR